MAENLIKNLFKTVGDFLNPAPKILSGSAKFLGLDQLSDSLGTGKSAESLFNSWTQAAPTGRDLWQAQREDTSNQRAVSDLKAAGLNPALMYGGSGQALPSSPASSGQGISFSDLLELSALPAKIANLKANTKNIEADTNKKVSETEGQNISNEFAAQINQSALDSQRVSRELTRHQIHEVDSKIDYMEQNRQNLVVDMAKSIKELSVMDAQISRISTQNLESMADILLKRVSASRIAALLPYEQLYMSAKTEAERGAAAASFAQAAWQNGLINSDYVETTCKALEISNSINEVKAALSNPNYEYNSFVLDKAGRSLLATISAIINPFKGILSF